MVVVVECTSCVVNLCGTSAGPLWASSSYLRGFGGTSAGFPLMYRPPKLRVVPADVRLRVNHQFDVLHRSLGVVASPGFQSSLFDGLEGLCDHSRTSSSGTFDEFSSRFRSLPASSGLQDSLHQPPWSPGDSPSRASSCSRPLSTWDGLDTGGVSAKFLGLTGKFFFQ